LIPAPGRAYLDKAGPAGAILAWSLGEAGLKGASAQIAGAQQSHSDPAQLEEIVVTAEKRESTVQTTPISLTAVSGQDIQDRGLTTWRTWRSRFRVCRFAPADPA
jgi:outer membrane receptor protein involved in Fe transport